MVTLMMGYLSGISTQQILGWVLTGLEILLVLVKFLQFVVDKDTKFGRFLSKLLPGLEFLSKTAKNAQAKDEGKKEEQVKEEKEHEDKR